MKLFLRRYTLVIAVILTALMLIMSVVVVFNKRIHDLEVKQQLR